MAHEDRAFFDRLEERGVSRRDFLKYCGSVAAMLGLADTMAPTIAAAVEQAASSKLFPAVWLNGGACTGCTESIAQATYPDVASIVLDILSMNHMETIMMAQGEAAEKALQDTITQYDGGFVLIYEGAVMTGWDGNALRVSGRPQTEVFDEVGPRAAAIIAIGACAIDGGWVKGSPNPAGAMGVGEYIAQSGWENKPPVINLPTCPANPEWLTAVVIDAVVLGELANGKILDKLDEYGRPKLMFGQTIHDQCPRRGHFENGEFVYQFGSEEEAKGYCLYPVGCKGPQTHTNCPIVRWNNQVSWCVESGSPCIGCGGYNWVDNNSPFLERFRRVGIDAVSDGGWNPAVVGAVAGAGVVGALAVHGLGMKAAGRIGEGPATEKEKDYDRKRSKKGGDK